MEIVSSHAEFVVGGPSFLFAEGAVKERVTDWPEAYFRRK